MALYSPVPANHFRILRIDKCDDDVVECSLHCHNLEDAPEYSAISYTWGQAEEKEFLQDERSLVGRAEYDIKVNGCIRAVTPNLFDLLVQFGRCFPTTTNYWIDALCINQADIEEKTVQVNQMDRVYGEAYNVVVWLGRENRCFPKVHSMIKQLALAYDREYKAHGHVRNLTHLNDPEDEAQMAQLGLSKVTQNDWLALIAFYQRRWFYRIWTVQEAALAQRVIVRVGQHQLDWEDILFCTRVIADTPLINALIDMGQTHFQRYDIAFTAASFLGAQMLVVGRGDKLGFERKSQWYSFSNIYDNNEIILDILLRSLRNFSATDLRDHIFALLGIMKAIAERHVKKPMSLVADYGLDASDLYKNVMAHMLLEHGSLTLLSRVQPPSKAKVTGLPSWVIDFSVSTARPFLDLPQFNRSAFDASNGASFRFAIEGRTLTAYCVVLSHVTHVGEAGNDLNETRSLEKTAELAIAYSKMVGTVSSGGYELMKAMTCDQAGLYETRIAEDELMHAFRAMLLVIRISQIIEGLKEGNTRSKIIENQCHQNTLAGTERNGPMPSSTATIALCERIGILENGLGQIDDFVKDKLLKDCQPFNLIIKRTMVMRRTFLTSDGLIGLGSEDVRPGDELCLIADGGRTPFLTRGASKDMSEPRILLGEAYVRDLMYGEGVEIARKHGLEWKPVSIV